MTTQLPDLHAAPALVLLPPSEGKAPGGSGDGWQPDSGRFHALSEQRSEIAAALRSADGGSQRLLGVGGDHLERARRANRALVGSPTLPAWQRYTGVVWSHLEPDSVRAADRRRIVVVSGLLGLVRGDDPVPDYRLKMGASLGDLGKLSTWWRPSVSSALDRAARNRVVIDLLPKEHRAAWQPGSKVRGVSIGFVDRSGRAGGHFAKAAKGRLAGTILRDGVDAIERWDDERFDLELIPL